MVYVKYGRSGGGWGCLVLGILALVAAYYILKGLFYLLYWTSPVLFVLALIINWRAVADTGRDFLGLLQRNLLGGLLVGVLAVIGFPILALFLFLRALGYKQMEKLGRMMHEHNQVPEDEFVEFEEIESRPKHAPPNTETEQYVELDEASDEPEPVEKPRPADDNPYDQFFK